MRIDIPFKSVFISMSRTLDDAVKQTVSISVLKGKSIDIRGGVGGYCGFRFLCIPGDCHFHACYKVEKMDVLTIIFVLNIFCSIAIGISATSDSGKSTVTLRQTYIMLMKYNMMYICV